MREEREIYHICKNLFLSVMELAVSGEISEFSPKVIILLRDCESEDTGLATVIKRSLPQYIVLSKLEVSDITVWVGSLKLGGWLSGV